MPWPFNTNENAGKAGFVCSWPASWLLIYYSAFAFIFPVSVVPVFSPDDGARILHFIDGAESTLDIEMYVFSSRDVVEALEEAKDRGVNVRIILEKNTISNDNADIFSELAAKGFLVRYASEDFKLTHSKFIIRDGKEVLVGSHNFSNSALFHNREASIITNHAPAVQEFIEIFEHDWNLS